MTFCILLQQLGELVTAHCSVTGNEQLAGVVGEMETERTVPDNSAAATERDVRSPQRKRQEAQLVLG